MAAVVRPAFILFDSFFLLFLAKMASNWGCALSSNAPYSRINTVYKFTLSNFFSSFLFFSEIYQERKIFTLIIV